MLVTHVRPGELWGKKVYDSGGRFLGEVIGIASGRGVVRRVVVTDRSRTAGATGAAEARVEPQTLVPRSYRPSLQRQLRVLR